MDNHRMRTRRSILQVSGFAGVGILAGCLGSNAADPPDETDTRETTDSPTQTPEPTESPTKTDPTETPEKFSARGNDSDRIEKDPENLVIMKSDLPGDGWNRFESSSSGGTDHSGWESTFVESTSDAMKEGIHSQVEVYNEVSQAKRRYNRLSYQGTSGQSPDESQELAIGVESTWYFAKNNEGEGTQYINHLRVRDANVFGFLRWFQTTEDEGFTPVELSAVGNLALVMHNKWR